MYWPKPQESWARPANNRGKRVKVAEWPKPQNHGPPKRDSKHKAFLLAQPKNTPLGHSCLGQSETQQTTGSIEWPKVTGPPLLLKLGEDSGSWASLQIWSVAAEGIGGRLKARHFVANRPTGQHNQAGRGRTVVSRRLAPSAAPQVGAGVQVVNANRAGELGTLALLPGPGTQQNRQFFERREEMLPLPPFEEVGSAPEVQAFVSAQIPNDPPVNCPRLFSPSITHNPGGSN